jgi:hypothetical protein
MRRQGPGRLGIGAARRRRPSRSPRNPRGAIRPPLNGHHVPAPRRPLARDHRRSHLYADAILDCLVHNAHRIERPAKACADPGTAWGSFFPWFTIKATISRSIGHLRRGGDLSRNNQLKIWFFAFNLIEFIGARRNRTDDLFNAIAEVRQCRAYASY